MARHIVPRRVYYTVFFALIVFTGITVWVAFLDLGIYNNVAAIGIAIVKATLVIMYFMHVRYSSRLTWLFVASGFLFLVILLVFVMSDVSTRDSVTQPQSWQTETVGE